MSNLKSLFASIAGNENADLDASLIQQVEVTAEEAAEAVIEKEIVECEKDIAEHDHQMEKHEDAIDAIEEKVEELEEVIEGLESQMTGNTAFNAGLFAHQYAQGAKIVAKMGGAVERHGAESFSDASTANLNALAGVEAMKEMAGKAAGAAKKFFVELYNGFIAVITGLFNRFKGIEKKAANMKAQVSGAGADKFTGEVTRSGSAKWADQHGKAPKVVDAIIAAGNTLSATLEAGNAGGIVDGIDSVINKLAAMGTKTTEGDKVIIDVNGGRVEIHAPKDDADLGKVSIAVKAPGDNTKWTAPKPTKSALEGICSEVAAQAKKLQIAKFDSKALTATRDKAIAMMEKRGAEEGRDGADVKSGVGAIKAGHRAGMKLIRGAFGLAGDVLDGQLSFVKACIGGKAAPAEKDDKGAKDNKGSKDDE